MDKQQNDWRVLLDTNVWIGYYATLFSMGRRQTNTSSVSPGKKRRFKLAQIDEHDYTSADSFMVEYINYCLKHHNILLPSVIVSEVKLILNRMEKNSKITRAECKKACTAITLLGNDQYHTTAMSQASLGRVEEMYAYIRGLRPEDKRDDPVTKRLLRARDSWADGKYNMKFPDIPRPLGWDSLPDYIREDQPPEIKVHANGRRSRNDMSILACALCPPNRPDRSGDEGSGAGQPVYFITGDRDFTEFFEYILQELSVHVINYNNVRGEKDMPDGARAGLC